MALVAAKLQKKLESVILAALTKEFATEAGADPTSHARMAKALSEIATVIVDTLQQDAQVAPGIPVKTASAGATTAPGKII